MRVEQAQADRQALDLLEQAIGELELGGPETDRAGLCVLMREFMDCVAARADIPRAMLSDVQDGMRRCASGEPIEAWLVALLDALRRLQDHILSVAQEHSAVKSIDDPFAGYGPRDGADDRQFADSPNAGGGLETGTGRSGGMTGALERPDQAGALPDFAWEPAGPPDEAGFAGAEPPPVPRMQEADAVPVQMGVSAPAACPPGNEFTARFVAYPPGDEAEVDALLKKLSPRSESLLGLQHCLWKPGTPVRVSFTGKGLVVDPPAQDFVWQGARVLLAFDVTVPQATPEGTVVLKFDVSIDGITVARLRMDLEIRAGSDKASVRSADAQAATTAFASYSSHDRQRVLDRVAALQISAGMDIFLDCLSLHPGEHWEPRLEDEIRRRDLFLLFWSRPASESKWVEWEWRKALADGKKDDMEIHPLDNGIKPPPELIDLHFADPAMAVRAASGPPT